MTSNQTQVLELYTAMFNRAADISGLNYWVNLMDQNNWSILDVAQSFSVQNEYTALYPSSQNTTTFITSIYNNLLGREPDTSGLNYWVNEISNGKIQAYHAVPAIIAGAKSNSTTQGIADAQLVTNKTAVSDYFANTLGLNDSTQAKGVMQLVTSATASVTTANALADSYSATKYGVDSVATFNGHKYLLVKSGASYADALKIAENLAPTEQSGLLKIETEAENSFILNFLKASNITTTADDGGGAVYTWLGATDAATEGTWLWSDNSALTYTNWGSANGATEPDNFDSSVLGGNYTGQQDSAAIALTDWPVGVTGQWNDVDGVNKLSYIIELGA